MKQLARNEFASALNALGKLVCRTSPEPVYRTIRIQTEDSALRLLTVSAEESLSVALPAVGDDAGFDCIVNFAELKDVLKGGNAGSVIFDQCDNELLMQLDSGRKTVVHSFTPLCVEWPQVINVPEQVAAVPLPEGFVGMLTAAAPIVDRSNYRRILQGINLSRDGITVTNGKELLNIPCKIAVDSFTIPFPLALMATKEQQGGSLAVWHDNSDDIYFRMTLGRWSWTGKAFSGFYPNWKQIVPNIALLKYSVTLEAEHAAQLTAFLKSVPDAPPNNPVVLSQSDGNLLAAAENGQECCIAAKFSTAWDDFELPVNKTLLLHLLQGGHTQLACADERAPFVASGGRGTYVAMPLTYHQKTNVQPNQQEEKEMNENTTNAVTASMPSVATVIKPETVVVNPLDDLSAALEVLRGQLKMMFDESAALSRKVKEVALSQKQKERDFIQAKRAIERIRMAI